MLRWIWRLLFGKPEPKVNIIHMHVHVDGRLENSNSVQALTQMAAQVGHQLVPPGTVIAMPSKIDDTKIDHFIPSLAPIGEPVVKFGHE